MPYLLLSWLLSISCLNVGIAQSNSHVLADTLFARQAYYKASELYKLNLNASDSTIKCHCWRQLAHCYSFLNDVKASESSYRSVFSNCKTGPSDFREFAKILQRSGEYEKAKRLYASCYAADSSDKFAYESMLFCDTINKMFDKITEVYLENLANINSPFDDVLDDALNDTLVFVSARKSKRSDKRSLSNNQYGYSRFKWHHSEGTVMLPGQGFTTSDNETNDFYISGSFTDTSKTFDSRTVIFRYKAGDIDTKGQLFSYDNGKSMYGHPNISSGGTMFFFVSDMPGGYGGTDIYLCRKTGTKWNAPLNLGKEINTAGNELFPFYLGEGLLVFTSDGRPGYGGYDLYTSMMKNNSWKTAINLGSPINSRSNDLAMRWDRVKKIFYLSSDRQKGKGALDIYRIHNFSSANLKSIF